MSRHPSEILFIKTDQYSVYPAPSNAVRSANLADYKPAWECLQQTKKATPSDKLTTTALTTSSTTK